MHSKMTAGQRQKHILEEISKEGRISVAEIAVCLNVSEMTVRRDLMGLEKRGLLKRNHGGATLLTAQVLDDLYSWSTRIKHHVEAKVAIANAAVQLIKEGDRIILHSGTTIAFMARLLRNYGNLTIVTNNVLVSEELIGCTQLDVLLTGGILNHDLKQLNGPLTLQCLNSIRADKVFLSCSSVSAQQGLFSTSVQDEVILEQTSIQNSQEAYLLVDHTKFQRLDFWVVGQIRQLKAIITNADVPTHLVQDIERQGVQCILA